MTCNLAILKAGDEYSPGPGTQPAAQRTSAVVQRVQSGLSHEKQAGSSHANGQQECRQKNDIQQSASQRRLRLRPVFRSAQRGRSARLRQQKCPCDGDGGAKDLNFFHPLRDRNQANGHRQFRCLGQHGANGTLMRIVLRFGHGGTWTASIRRFTCVVEWIVTKRTCLLVNPRTTLRKSLIQAMATRMMNSTVPGYVVPG